MINNVLKYSNFNINYLSFISKEDITNYYFYNNIYPTYNYKKNIYIYIIFLHLWRFKMPIFTAKKNQIV
uniref:Uncharacterized protein n=1 Tax=viral metagenome TaxID=1070528 RepID=A0A6C0ECI0_9ZZZZ